MEQVHMMNSELKKYYPQNDQLHMTEFFYMVDPMSHTWQMQDL